MILKDPGKEELPGGSYDLCLRIWDQKGKSQKQSDNLHSWDDFVFELLCFQPFLLLPGAESRKRGKIFEGFHEEKNGVSWYGLAILQEKGKKKNPSLKFTAGTDRV